MSIFHQHGLQATTAIKLQREVRPVYNLRILRTGQKYELQLNEQELISFRYQINPENYLHIEKYQGTFTGKIHKVRYQTKIEFLKGTIEESLFDSIIKIKERPELADLMASLYEYDIDFNTDIRKGDSYKILVEKKYLNDQFIKYGNLIVCEFINNKNLIQILRYSDPSGKTAYYHPDGRAVRKMFLRCPLPFMKVTSRFGMRTHPVHKFSARHNGIDFRAPVGTKVRATASGRIQSTGYSTSKGRFIIIRHPNKYYTHYYHLSGLAGKIKKGSRVDQGQVIGFVGNSGTSTGPHLHYGIKKQYRFINPFRLKSPSKEPVKNQYLAHFNRYKTVLLKHFSRFGGNQQFAELVNTLEMIRTSPQFIR